MASEIAQQSDHMECSALALILHYPAETDNFVQLTHSPSHEDITEPEPGLVLLTWMPCQPTAGRQKSELASPSAWRNV